MNAMSGFTWRSHLLAGRSTATAKFASTGASEKGVLIPAIERLAPVSKFAAFSVVTGEDAAKYTKNGPSRSADAFRAVFNVLGAATIAVTGFSAPWMTSKVIADYDDLSTWASKENLRPRLKRHELIQWEVTLEGDCLWFRKRSCAYRSSGRDQIGRSHNNRTCLLTNW